MLVCIGSCGPGLHAAAFTGCTPILSSISMQLMQATPHQQVFLRIYGTLQFPLLPASTTYRAGCVELQAAEVEQEPLLGTLSAQEAQESVDYARKRGWGRGGYQKLCQQDMEEQLRHESAAASRASAPSKRISTPTAPADPAAAASSGAGSASAGAAEHMASQVDTITLICRCCEWACSGVAAAFVCECWHGHLASTICR